MKYKTQIVQENNSFVGHAILDNDVVYTTNLHPDPVMVTRELTRFISSNTPTSFSVPPKPVVHSSSQVNLASRAFPVKTPVPSSPPPSNQEQTSIVPYTPVTNLPQRKCCGRG